MIAVSPAGSSAGRRAPGMRSRNASRARSSKSAGPRARRGGSRWPRRRRRTSAACSATSRSGERFWRRSGSGRAGSPSKSRITHPRGREQRLAEVVVAVDADRPAAGAELGAGRQLVADLLSAAGDRGEPLVVGQVDEDPLDLLVDRRGQQRHRLLARLLRAKAGSPASEASAACSRAVTLPSAASRASRPSGSECNCSSASSQPSTGVGQERLRRRRASRRTARPRTRTSPAAGRCSGSRARLRKRSISSSGLMPGLELAEHLQRDPVVEHDRGVRLLGAHQARRGRRRELGRRRPRGGSSSARARSRSRCRRSIRAISSSASRGSAIASYTVHSSIAGDASGALSVVVRRAGRAAAGRARACRSRTGSARARAAAVAGRAA